jgi:hypothetical protein
LVKLNWNIHVRLEATGEQKSFLPNRKGPDFPDSHVRDWKSKRRTRSPRPALEDWPFLYQLQQE